MEIVQYQYKFPFALDFEALEKEAKKNLADPVPGIDFQWIRPNIFRYGWKDTKVLRKKYVDWINDYCNKRDKKIPSNLEEKTTKQLRGMYQGILCNALKQKWYYQELLKLIKYETGIEPNLNIYQTSLEKLAESYENFKREWSK